MAVYLINGLTLAHTDTSFQQSLSDAYRSRYRPKCLCTEGGAEMYVARTGTRFVLKRMPLTGARHAAECASAEGHPINRSGTRTAQQLPAGACSIRLAFPMSEGATPRSRSGAPQNVPGLEADRISLGGLLDYLWNRASLTEWRPAFAGKRNWPVVRARLLEAARLTFFGRHSISDRLYIPEQFSLEDRVGIFTRRSSLWQRTLTSRGTERRFMLVIGEMKRLAPCHGGWFIRIKHVPDQWFSVDKFLYTMACARFRHELSDWEASPESHMIVIGTVRVAKSKLAVSLLSLMPVTADWLPLHLTRDTRRV